METLLGAVAGALAGKLCSRIVGLFGTPDVPTPPPTQPPPSSLPVGARNEAKCRYFVEKLLAPHPVAKVRPAWLRNPTTGRALEIDMFCADHPDGPVGVEYNGSLHYVLTELHRDERAFREQKRRDALKRRLCARHHVKLVVVPFTQRHRMEAFLREEFLKAGVRVSG